MKRAIAAKTSDDNITAPEMPDECADPASIPGAGAGAPAKSWAETVAEAKIAATMKATAMALNVIAWAIVRNREAKSKGNWFEIGERRSDWWNERVEVVNL